MPTGTLVIAQFGGSLTINSGTSQVLTYDPVGGTGARQVDLVGGTRYLRQRQPRLGRPAAPSSTRRAGSARCR